MCNLYRMTKSPGEVARWFEVEDATAGANLGDEVYPGYPGLVVAERRLRRMTWGFPLQIKGRDGRKLKPRPVNNARTDKLDSFFWKGSFEQRRCLIPLTGWAEAEGPKGGKTRTWLSLPGQELFACAGVWRTTQEWGECYSMVMTDAAGAAAEVHSRMPVILAREDYSAWLGGTPDAARALCRAWPGEIAIERTSQPWSARSRRSER